MCCNSKNHDEETTTCCSKKNNAESQSNSGTAVSPCCNSATATSCCPDSAGESKYAESRMIAECLEFAKNAKAAGKPIIGIMCEYAPREIINACSGVAVCLCGGSQKTVESAEIVLPSGICPVIKSTYGYLLDRSNPFLELADLIVAETTCDGKKKVFELMGKEKECYTLHLPQTATTPEAKANWEKECRKFAAFLEQRFNTEITTDKLNAAIRELNSERKLRYDLAEHMQHENPELTGRDILGFNSIISPLPWASERYTKALEKLETPDKCNNLQRRKRVLLTGVPVVHGAERVLELIENAGGLIVAQENCTGIKPLYQPVAEDTTDPIHAIAEKYLALPCSVMAENHGRVELLRQLAAAYRPECIIDLSWQGCHTYDLESLTIKDLADELSLPLLKIQSDYSGADTSALTTRLQALFELC